MPWRTGERGCIFVDMIDPRGRSPSLAVVLAAAVLACGDGGTGPDEPEPAGILAVSPDSATATAVGQEIGITVTLDGEPATPALSLQRESRWLHDVGVLNAAALASGILRTRAPGRAVVRVAVGSRTDSVIVNLVPSRPLIVEVHTPDGRTHIGDGDTILLRGFRMDAVTPANLSVAGGGLTVAAGADSANLGILIASAAAQPCGGTAGSLSIGLVGIDGPAIAGLTRKREGELTLDIGEARRLTDAEAACLRFAPVGSARYLLAYADSRLVDKATTQPEFPWPDSIDVTVENLNGQGSPVPAVSVRSADHPTAADPIHTHALHGPTGTAFPASHALPVGCPFTNHFLTFCRGSPYTLGESFLLYPAGSQRPAAQSRVLSIQGNLVAAVFLPDSALLPAGTQARLDTALARMSDRGVSLLQKTFDLAGPTRTSDESGQLLLSLEATTLSFANWWPDPSTGHGRWGKVTLHVDPLSAIGDPATNAVRVLLITAHEVLHTYQFRWRFEHGSPWLTYLGTAWGVEGAATFFSMEMVREALGVQFLSDHVVQTSSGTDPFGSLSLYLPGPGDFTGGYVPAASFLRDLTQRLVEDSGLLFDDAIAEVIAGALEGWWGVNEEGQVRGAGLTARMRMHLGTAWNPVDALLDWTMSQAADNLTPNQHFQNRTIRRPNPEATLTTLPHATIGSGSNFTIRRAPGNTGVFILDDGAGGSFRGRASVGASATDALEWLILRIG